MRALISEADPEMTEDWKWMGTPVWSHHGIVGATRDGRVATYVDISKHVGRVNRESMVLDEMAA